MVLGGRGVFVSLRTSPGGLPQGLAQDLKIQIWGAVSWLEVGNKVGPLFRPKLGHSSEVWARGDLENHPKLGPNFQPIFVRNSGAPI